MIIGVLVVLLLALFFQVVLNELPCPLCLLQRVGFTGIILGFLLNLRFGLRSSHYAISIISAVFTSVVALRQISLHVVPGTGSYGGSILGLHLYSWSFLLSILIIVVTAIMSGIDGQYQERMKHLILIPANTWVRVLFFIIMLLLLANIVFTYMECGLYPCPYNPK